MPDAVPVSEFRPSWLVRVSDMKAVPGSTVPGHYWALSYSWSQSGEIIHKGGEEYTRIDAGKHRIACAWSNETEREKYAQEEYQYYLGISGGRPEYLLDNGQTMFEYERRRKLYPDMKYPTIRVNFEGLIQQICKDADIDYIWYDQMCIDQNDCKAKMREIKQMHLIYKNALCTLALVPEYEFLDEEFYGMDDSSMVRLAGSQWCQRMWTLEEAYVSTRILFVGRNVHLLSDISAIWTSTATLLHYQGYRSHPKKLNACTVLWYARYRTSSKAHDQIFALLNIFPEIQDSVTFTYNQPLIQLMTTFYSRLAEQDASILLFGAPLHISSDEYYGTPYVPTLIPRPESDSLPSWTGSKGLHIPQYLFEDQFFVAPSNYTIVDDHILWTSSFVVANIEPSTTLEHGDDISPWPPSSSAPFTKSGYMGLTFVITERTVGTGGFLRQAREYGCEPTHFLPTKIVRKGPKDRILVNTLAKPEYCGGYLSLVEECSECIIPTGVCFRAISNFVFYPVIKKVDKNQYKSIGVCLLYDFLNVESFTKPKQTFNIR